MVLGRLLTPGVGREAEVPAVGREVVPAVGREVEVPAVGRLVVVPLKELPAVGRLVVVPLPTEGRLPEPPLMEPAVRALSRCTWATY